MTGPNPLTDIIRTDPEDCLLVARARSGEGDALEDLVRRHQAWIYNIAVRMLHHPQDGAAGCLALEPFELNALHLHQDDQALELGALHVIAGSGVEIQGYARGDWTSRDRSGRKYSGQRRR